MSCDVLLVIHVLVLFSLPSAGALASTRFMLCLLLLPTLDWVEQPPTRLALCVLPGAVLSTIRLFLSPTLVVPAALSLAWALASSSSNLYPTTPPPSSGQSQTSFQLEPRPLFLVVLQWVLRLNHSFLCRSWVPLEPRPLCLLVTMRSMTPKWTTSVRGWQHMSLMVSGGILFNCMTAYWDSC